MNNDNAIGLHTLEQLDPLQEVLKRGAQALFSQAVESELESRLAEHFTLKIED